MKQIVCVSYARWEESPKRLANLFQRLEDVEILFFEPAQPALSSLRRPREGTRLAKGITAYTLPAAITWAEDTYSRYDRLSRRNAHFIQTRMVENDFQNPLLWLTCPGDVALADKLDHYGLVYDCDRDWTEAPEGWERSLCELAEVVFAVSPALEKRLGKLSTNVALIPNGVDYPLFAQAGDVWNQFPADLNPVQGTVIGVLGQVDDFTWLKPVLYCAREHPEWSFVFVGSFSHRNPSWSALRQLNNVHLLGEKSPKTLPRYLSRFDLCLAVRSERPENPHVAPECLCQYLATGKPIAAMVVEGTETLGDGIIIYVWHDEDLAQACRRALVENTQELARRRRNVARKRSWKQLARQVQFILETNGFI